MSDIELPKLPSWIDLSDLWPSTASGMAERLQEYARDAVEVYITKQSLAQPSQISQNLAMNHRQDNVCMNNRVGSFEQPAQDAAPEWQPIETAPKGKKVISGYLNKLGMWRTTLAKFYPAGTLQNDPDGDYYDEFAPEGWYEESESHETILRTDEVPTHWMPLPSAPDSEKVGS